MRTQDRQVAATPPENEKGIIYFWQQLTLTNINPRWN